LFGDPSFCESIGLDRNVQDTSQWWGSPECKCVAEYFAEAKPGLDIINDPNVSPVSLGFDFSNMYTFKDHSGG
jgi:hypothetical protein